MKFHKGQQVRVKSGFNKGYEGVITDTEHMIVWREYCVDFTNTPKCEPSSFKWYPGFRLESVQ